MKNLARITLSLLFSLSASADPGALVSDFKLLIKNYGLGASTNQSFCYLNGSKVEGYQVNKLQRIASVSKLFTTLMASETLDLHRTFKTTFYLSGDRLHIEGSRDPYFEEDKFLLLVQSLNKLGYKKFSQITFNSDFKFYDLALGAHAEITPSITRSRISFYVNRANGRQIQKTWESVQKYALEEGIALDSSEVPAMTAGKVFLSNLNPLINENPEVLVHLSKPLHSILKSMNVRSKNYVSQNIFDEASRVKTVATLMSEFNVPAGEYRIYNGSGLPVIRNSRLDNQATCSLVLRINLFLRESLKKHQLGLSDVLAVNGGKDLGTFRTRFMNHPETHQAVISKTGTLKHTSSLAGYLFTEEVLPFAVLNHTTNADAAREMQDEFVARMFHHLGQPIPIDYEKISIFPWGETPFFSSQLALQ